MPDRTEHYAELRAKYPQLPEGYWTAMQREDDLRDERDALRNALAHLIGYHTATGTAVPIEKLKALLDASEPRQGDEPSDEPSPEGKTHGTGCPPGCCGAGVRQWR